MSGLYFVSLPTEALNSFAQKTTPMTTQKATPKSMPNYPEIIRAHQRYLWLIYL